jgi:iron complex outermembrane recepter protein
MFFDSMLHVGWISLHLHANRIFNYLFNIMLAFTTVQQPPLCLRGIFRVVAIALALILPSIVFAQQTSTSTISGKVSARDGTVLSRASVAINDGKQAVVADNEGRFEMKNVQPGEYTLVVSHVGYAPLRTPITVRAGMSEYVDIVLDERPSGSTIIVTAPRIAYRPQTSSTALKTSTPLLETPATVQIVTAERLSEQKADRVSDIFDYMTGINLGGGTRAQAYLMRGFAVDDRFIPYQVDGVSGGVWRQHEPPSAIIERIEYLKGPSSTLYGITQIGGLINYITRKPQSSRQASLELRHSTYAGALSKFGARNSANVTADMTGPLDEEGRFLYRVIANHINTASYRTDVEESSLDVLPELTWNISDATQFTASMNLSVDKGRWDEYLPVPGRDLSKIPCLDTRINEPEDNYWDYGWGLGYIIRHTLNEDWVIRSVGRHTSRIDGRQLFEFAGLKGDNQTMRRNWRDQFNERYYNYADVTAEGRLVTGPLSHTLLAGATIGNELIHFDRRNLQGDSTLEINIYEPVHEASVMLPAKPGFDRYWDNMLFGGYIQDQVEIIPQLQVVAGVQYTSASTHHEERRSGLVFEKHDAGFSPRVGVVVLPVENLSVFGSFSTSIVPTNAEQENAEGNLDFEPQRGQQIEGGVKFDLLDARVGGTVSLYQLEYRNAVNATGERNANGNTIFVQTGRSRSKGVEVDLFVSPITGLYLTTGYAYTDARVVEDANAARVDQRLPFVPYNAFNVWATYELPIEMLSGLKLGIGATYLDDRPTEFPTATGQLLVLPSYTRFDGLISYDVGGAMLSLNVQNLLDERYYASGGVSRIVPGAPRTIRTSLMMRL